MEKRKIIIDTDTGTDDSVAIMAALLSKKIEVVAVCAVWGNLPLEHTYRNALKTLHLVGADNVPVYKGCAKPMVKFLSPSRVDYDRDEKMRWLREEYIVLHGKKFYYNQEDFDLEESPRGPEEQDACSFYVEYLRSAEEPVTIVAIGPLTNLAMALRMDPSITKNIDEIVVMGGGCRQTNTTSSAEYNIWCDPESAQIVLSCGVKQVWCPLDATHIASFDHEDAEKFRSLGTAAGNWTADMIDCRIASYDKMQPFNPGFAPIHDALCVAYLIDPAVLTDLPLVRCDVDCGDSVGEGQTIVDPRAYTEEKNCYFAFNADRLLFRDILMECFKYHNVAELEDNHNA